MVATKLFEFSKVRLKNQKNGAVKHGFVVEVHVLDDKSKRFIILWNGCDVADKKFYKGSDLIAAEINVNEINRAVAYKSREAKRQTEKTAYRNQINQAVKTSLTNHEKLSRERQTSNSKLANSLRPGTSIKETIEKAPDINLDARNYQVCVLLFKDVITSYICFW